MQIAVFRSTKVLGTEGLLDANAPRFSVALGITLMGDQLGRTAQLSIVQKLQITRLIGLPIYLTDSGQSRC
jgi:hypothetical protein